MKAGVVIREIICVLLAVVFAYTGFSKFFDWKETLNAFGNQVFPYPLAMVLARVIPALELVLAVLLLIPKYRKPALAMSTALLLAFSLYVGLVLTGIFGRVPCSCGGMISSLGWEEHLVLNVFLFGIGIWGWGIIKNEELRMRNEKLVKVRSEKWEKVG